MKTLARVGYAANGLLHILIGVLAISVAFGSSSQDADQQGALAAIAAQPFGVFVLWAIAIGLVGLALWGVTEAILASDSDSKERWKERAKQLGKSIAYAAIAVTAFRFATGGGSGSGDGSAESLSARLLATPFGVVLLLILAAGVIAIGAYFVYKGATRKFCEDLVVPSGAAGTVTEVLGLVGYIAKGLALVIVGILFAVAAVTADPGQAAGIDGALMTIAAAPFGTLALVVVGAGFVAYGVYSFVRARRARL